MLDEDIFPIASQISSNRFLAFQPDLNLLIIRVMRQPPVRAIVVHDDPREIQLLVPLHRVAMLLLEKKLSAHFQLLALVVSDPGDQVVESKPIRDAERNQTPSYSRSREPGVFATNWKASL